MQALQLPGLALNPLKFDVQRVLIWSSILGALEEQCLAYGGATEGLNGFVVYTDLFDQATIARMVGTFSNIARRDCRQSQPAISFTALNNR